MVENGGSLADAGRIKLPFVYWFWRIYCPVVWLAFAVLIVLAATERQKLYFDRIMHFAPFFVVVVFGFLNLGAFPFAYSVFGTFRRSPLPSEPELTDIKFSWACIGRLNSGPGLIWLIYEHGIGFKIPLIGTAFIPLSDIDAIDFDGFLTATIWHHSAEVRAPIKAPKKVARIMAHYYPEKVRSS